MIKRTLVLISMFLLAGCAASSQTAFSMEDQMFAFMMIPHHEQAIEMSLLVPSRTANQEIRELAQQIMDAQAPEIVQMKEWGNTGAEDHSAHGAGFVMNGMLTTTEMEALAAARGGEFERLFLEGMIAHHEGAIRMAQDALKSRNEEVRTFAAKIVSAQDKEIQTMRELLRDLTHNR